MAGLAFTAPSAKAATATWTGATSGDWNQAANWGGTSPTFDNTLDIIYSASGASNLYTYLNVTRTIRSLTFNDDVDSDVSIRLTNTAAGTTSRGLRFESNDPDNVAPSITVLSGATGNIDLGVAGGRLRLSSDLHIDHNGSGTFTISRPVADGYGIIKTGTGKLVFSADNEYTGATQVLAGTLIVNGSTALESTVTVAAGATLGGSGTVFGNAVISGVHTPGNSPGIQTFGSNLTYEAGASVIWELAANTASQRGTDFDGINVGGSLSFSGQTTLELSFGNTVSWSDEFWAVGHEGTEGWLLYDGVAGIDGFDNLDLADIDWLDAAGLSLSSIRDGASFSLSRIGNDIYLTYSPVPEPTSTGLAVAGGALLLLARARKRG